MGAIDRTPAGRETPAMALAIPRVVIVLVLLYLALDFSNPMLRGAFSFNPDHSVDGVRAEPPGERIASPAALLLPEHVRVDPKPPAPRVVREAVAIPRFTPRAAPFRHAPRGASPEPSPEDH